MSCKREIVTLRLRRASQTRSLVREIKINLSNPTGISLFPPKCGINAHFFIISAIFRMVLLFFWLLNCYGRYQPFRLFASFKHFSLHYSLSIIIQAWNTSFSVADLFLICPWQAIKVFISAENFQFRNWLTAISSFQVAKEWQVGEERVKFALRVYPANRKKERRQLLTSLKP